MDIKDYKARLDRLNDRTRANLVDMAGWATAEALPWLWRELAGMTSRTSLVRLSAPHTIRQGLQTSLSDREEMPLKESFYVANLSMLDSEVSRYCDLVSSVMPDRTLNEFTVYELHGGLHDLLFEGIVLLEQAGHALHQLPTMYGAWARRQETPFEIFKGAEQAIYGRFSGLTHADRARWIPVSVLRTGLETRIRQAFGIQSYLNPANKSLRPIDMRKLFEEVGSHLAKIQFAVDFHDITKVYGWSNPYLHAGWRDFVWVPGYVLQFLRPLFSGQKAAPGAGWSINDGIRMPRATWLAIRAAFEQEGKNDGLDLNHADEKDAGCILY